MYYSDYHLHTHFSGDSNTPPEAMIEQAMTLGLKKLCITDHFDADFPYDDISFTFDIDTYFSTLQTLKETYRNKIQLLIGVELGLQPHLADLYTTMVNTYPFDFIIGSSHLVDGVDPYRKTYYEGKTAYEAYDQYLMSIIENIHAFQDFQVYGHLDYIVRYSPYEDKLIAYQQYGPTLDRLLQSLIDKGKGLEVNTSGLRNGFGNPHPNRDILNRYYELGGEIITIGSDAHQPKDLGTHFQEAYSLLKAIGFNYTTVFVNRQPEFIKIP